ncbi:MAG: hypothetical protein HVN34_03865 [Methanobacteriaceae archaeon]|jgi:hypothetical protein|nr:hypothetical protein [Methanobacteriaceae archaeon]
MENKTFNYYLPQLGRLNVFLYSYTTKCYNLLDNYGHIERLKNIDQLGVIRNIYEGAHHPRWEYVILQLYLINRLKKLDLAKGLGLSSKTTNFLNYRPSGAEILQIWILLLNSGHLPGTFASERGLLRTFKESAKLRNVFKGGLRPEEKKFFNRILENEDIYSIHKILISFHLGRYHRFKDYDIEGSKFAEFLREIVNFYLFEPQDENLANRRFKLKSTFRRIRQISYLFLDSQYAPFPVNFDLSKIFLNLEDYYRDIFVEPESQILKTLASFDDLLSISLYHSSQCISELGKHAIEIQAKLEGEELSRYSIIQKYLINESNEFEPTKISDEDYILHILFDLSMDNILKDNFKSKLSFEKEKKWNNLFGKNGCLTTFQSSANVNQYVINLRIFQNSPLDKNMNIMGHFLKNFVELYFNLRKETKYYKGNIDRVFSYPFEELLLEILKYITATELYFEFKDKYNQEFLVLPISGSKTAPKKIESIFEFVNVSDSRKNELNGLKGTLNHINHRGKLLVALSPILIYNRERKILTDLDGFALGFLNGELKILLVEAKNQRNGRISACRSQLKNTLNKLNIITLASKDIIELPEHNCVFSYFGIDGKV